MARYEVTRTWDDRPWTGEMRLPLHEVTMVDGLAEVGAGIEWQNVGRDVWYGNNGRCGQSGLVTYIARPIRDVAS